MWVQKRVGVIGPSRTLAPPVSLTQLSCPRDPHWPLLAIVALPPGQPVPMESEGELCQGYRFGNGE